MMKIIALIFALYIPMGISNELTAESAPQVRALDFGAPDTLRAMSPNGLMLKVTSTPSNCVTGMWTSRVRPDLKKPETFKGVITKTELPVSLYLNPEAYLVIGLEKLNIKIKNHCDSNVNVIAKAYVENHEKDIYREKNIDVPGIKKCTVKYEPTVNLGKLNAGQPVSTLVTEVGTEEKGKLTFSPGHSDQSGGLLMHGKESIGYSVTDASFDTVEHKWSADTSKAHNIEITGGTDGLTPGEYSDTLTVHLACE